MDGGAKHPLVEEARRKKWANWKSGDWLAVFHQAVDLPAEHADGAKAPSAACGSRYRLPRALDMELKPRGEHPVLRA